jgi:protein-L-isoaspartate(D-aspartate) O-methyltransferase
MEPPRSDSFAATSLAEGRALRVRMAAKIDAELGPFDRAQLAALIDVPRERFVRPTDIARATEDVPLPLDDQSRATISAPHAYLLSFRILNLKAGDSLVELGSGSGYGAALAATICGKNGQIDTFEVDEELAQRATDLLAHFTNVKVRWLDAHGSESFWSGAKRVVVTFAVSEIPRAWIDALGDGGILVAPVGPPGGPQKLISVSKNGADVRTREHGGVRYVPDRSTAI